MIKKDITNIKCQLIPLTPIHIGSGNELFAYDYVIKNNKFFRISLENFFEKLEENQKKIFIELIEKEDFIKIRKFIKDNYKKEYGYLYSSNVNEDISENYDTKIGGARKANENNFLSIFEFIGNCQGKYIPGSTIKGYLRTVYIGSESKNLYYNISRESKIRTAPFISKNREDNLNKEIAAKALGLNRLEPKFDPFKNITITDTNIVSDFIEIRKIERVNSKNKPPLPMGMHEVTRSLFSTGDNIIFDFNFVIKNYSCTLEKILKELSIEKEESIVKELKDFYIDGYFEALKEMSIKILDEDILFFKKINDKKYLKACEKIKEYALNLNDNEALIKIGKGSGFNSKTLNLFNKNKKEIYTRAVVEEYPVGWAILSYVEE